ncbi:MAG: tetratricopeptide repeat protein, partial [Candidatus Marinimicrobia bacterium]|nr:tetratricopeptide repeat protein [Candidatus Neomarinimicrobiota bacterium]
MLHQIWNLEYISEEEKEEINVRRLIDFDVIFYNLIGNVHRKLQSEILLEIADTSLKFSEFENAAFTYNYLLKRLYKYLTRNALPDIHHKLAQALFWKNLLPSAKRHFSRSLNLYEEINNPVGIARAKNGLAIVSVEEGKLKEGENLILEAMEILKNLQTPPTESKVLRANILMNQGNLYHMRGEFKKAISQYKEAHKYVKDLETTELTTGLLFYNMAIAYKTLEQPEKAEELLQKALEVAEEIKNRNLKALALSLKAEILAYGGKFSEAHATAITAFTIFNQINNKAN